LAPAPASGGCAMTVVIPGLLPQHECQDQIAMR
jgi:hypothetical protein